MGIHNTVLRYGTDFRSLHIDERNLLGVIEPGRVPIRDPSSVIADGLDNPIDSPALEELVEPGNRVTILVDDNTRPTPVDLLLPPVLKRLTSAGVKPKDISILIGGGTHRPMTEAEIVKKVGSTVRHEYEVLNHRWLDADQLVTIESTAAGVPVKVNRLVTEADFCMGIGDIAPHPLAGWSGGGKILQPGACGQAITSAIHSLTSYYPVLSFVGNENSPIRLEIERVARNAGLSFMVNTVLDPEWRIAKVVAGDIVAAHRAGVQFSRKIWTASIPDVADIVIASSYPADLDFWQAVKTLWFMECAVKRGGDMILLTPCPEGISRETSHREVILRYAAWPSKEVLAQSQAAREWDEAAVNVAVHVALARELADVTIVSDGLTASHCKSMGIGHCSDLSEALRHALQRKGEDAGIAVLPFGPRVLPVVGLHTDCDFGEASLSDL